MTEKSDYYEINDFSEGDIIWCKKFYRYNVLHQWWIAVELINLHFHKMLDCLKKFNHLLIFCCLLLIFDLAKLFFGAIVSSKFIKIIFISFYKIFFFLFIFTLSQNQYLKLYIKKNII